MKPNKIGKPIPVAEFKRQVSKNIPSENNKKDGEKDVIKNISRKSTVEPGKIHSAKKFYTGDEFLPVSGPDPKEKTMNDPASDDPNESRSQDDSNPTKNDPATEKGL